MKWFNLKRNKCPQCGRDFMDSMRFKNGIISHRNCGFHITEQRYKEIVSGMVEKQLQKRNKFVNIQELLVEPISYNRTKHV